MKAVSILMIFCSLCLTTFGEERLLVVRGVKYFYVDISQQFTSGKSHYIVVCAEKLNAPAIKYDHSVPPNVFVGNDKSELHKAGVYIVKRGMPSIKEYVVVPLRFGAPKGDEIRLLEEFISDALLCVAH